MERFSMGGPNHVVLTRSMSQLLTTDVVARETVWVGQRGGKYALKGRKFIELMAGVC